MSEKKVIRMHSGCEISGPMADNAVTQKEWLEEGKALFGTDFKQWKFVCPMCGHVASIQDFKDTGADANCAYQECIGRYTGKGSPKEGDSGGCNWAAYGLFGTGGKGRVVISDDGTGTEVFQFAKPLAH